MTAAEDLHQRGLAAAAAERFEEAVALLEQAVSLAPLARQFRTNLGLGLARLGRHADAAAAYRSALELEPHHAPTLAKLGRVLTQAGLREEAVASLERAASLDPFNPDTANALGAALGAEEPARVAFRRAVELDPGFGEAWRNLGLLEAALEQWPAAAQALERAVALEPPSPGLVYQFGVALARSGRHVEARDAYRRAVELDPGFGEAWNNLAHELAALGEPEAALAAVERALEVKPDYVEARYNLGVTLQTLGRTADARRAYQLVLAAAGAHADAYNNLGGLCLSEGEAQQAIPLYRKALETDAAHPEARWNLGLAELTMGEWEEGWSYYEARRPGRAFDIPRWNRTLPLAGRSVLVWCEQGLGDGIQFARYAVRLRELGAARIVMECPRVLTALLASGEGIDQVIERGAPVPRVDYQISSMSLPFELQTREDTVPAPGPRYRLDDGRRHAWRRQLDERPGRKIGIVWGGSAANRKGLDRSMPLRVMTRLAACRGVTLISLQHGPQTAELETCPEVLAWPQRDLMDTVALAAELDLTITVDTLMAHLAGTVARRTWVLLPFVADWRWMRGRADSPWYPGMRLFRQSRPGDWAGLMERVAAALDALD